MSRVIALLVVGVLAALPAAAGKVNGTVDCGGDCAETLVYLEGGASANGDGATVIFDQKEKVFIPHLLPILSGTTVNITNGDPFLHNVHIYSGKDTVLNIALPFPGQVVPHTFTETGTYAVLCDAHPEMSAFIVVLGTPHFATVADGGSYEIADVPPGSYTLVVENLSAGRAARSPIEVK